MSEQLSPEAQNQEAEGPSPVEIRIENLYRSFGSHRVLDGIKLKIHSGEMVAIVGGSGSGKTTLLRHVIGLDQPDR
jgi:ABC-type transporter Mla maintaining outer membrane lipid asymmetry ATPase subunit MlaF